MTTSESSAEERDYSIEQARKSRRTGRRAEREMTSGHDERAEAFACWARQRMPQAYRMAVSILRDEAAAQDAVQDAVVRAWVAWPRLRERSRLDPWLDRIIVNCCRDGLRKEARNSHAVRALSLDGDD
jgi:DNA-directed RNA polymerase specialized sigma24 family protein